MERSRNKLQGKLKPNEIDLCADASEQPMQFANWIHSLRMGEMVLKLELTPEVLQAIEDTKKLQDQILRLKVVDWTELENTRITCFDL